MILIRADGNAAIGAGHLMRCLTIADAVEQSWERVLFVCADEDSAAFAGHRYYRTHVLHTDYRHPETELQTRDDGGSAWQELMEDVRVQDGEAVTILVDSYYVTEKYLESLRRFGRVFLMEDTPREKGKERIFYPADGLINYNLFARQEGYEAAEDRYPAGIYLGGSYIPIRPQFLDRGRRIRQQVRDVLITTGGGDAENIAGRILRRLWRKDWRFHVVSGGFNPHMEELKRMALEMGGIRVYKDVTDMASLMENCDLAVTAGGTTVYELCALGIPFVCFSCAANQEALAEYVEPQGLGLSAGAWHLAAEETLEAVAAKAGTLAGNAALREACSARERAAVDGRGAERIARLLLG